MIAPNIESLVEKYGSGEKEVNISIGLRPSGMIHLGNMMALALAQGVARKVGPHYTQINVTICDLDLPSQGDWDIQRTGYVKHYRDLPDKNGSCHSSMSDHATEQVSLFLQSLNQEVSIRHTFRTLTEVQRHSSFREGLKRILDDPDIMPMIIPNIPKGGALVYPLCANCGTSYKSNRKGKYTKYENGIIHTFCNNPECSVEEYDMNVLDTSQDLAVHLFIDPLRDAVMEPFADIHVFGGDYNELHGPNKISKIKKILHVMQVAGQGLRQPDIFLGPTVYARDGSKMSKSRSNGLDINHLKKYFGEDYARRIFDFTMNVVERGYKNIDYTHVTESLFGSTHQGNL